MKLSKVKQLISGAYLEGQHVVIRFPAGSCLHNCIFPKCAAIELVAIASYFSTRQVQ